jgi:hypothetical protein
MIAEWVVLQKEEEKMNFFMTRTCTVGKESEDVALECDIKHTKGIYLKIPRKNKCD